MLNWPKLFPKWKSKIGGWWPNFRARQRTLNIPQRPILAATCHPCAKISQRLGLCRLYLDLRGAVGRGGGPSEPAWKQQWDSVCLHLAGFSPLSTSRLDFYLSSFCLGWVFFYFKILLERHFERTWLTGEQHVWVAEVRVRPDTEVDNFYTFQLEIPPDSSYINFFQLWTHFTIVTLIKVAPTRTSLLALPGREERRYLDCCILSHTPAVRYLWVSIIIVFILHHHHFHYFHRPWLLHLEDRPAQLSHIWIFIYLCKYTNLRITAGQSAT